MALEEVPQLLGCSIVDGVSLTNFDLCEATLGKHSGLECIKRKSNEAAGIPLWFQGH